MNNRKEKDMEINMTDDERKEAISFYIKKIIICQSQIESHKKSIEDLNNYFNVSYIKRFQIDKNIPIPPIENGAEKMKRAKQNKYPFKEMEIGDSFLFDHYNRYNMWRVSNAARNWANHMKNKKKFVCRKVLYNGMNMIRVWRVK